MKKRFFAALFTFFSFVCFSQSNQSKAEYKPLGFAGINKPRVCELRTKYLTTHKDWLYRILDEGECYRIYIRNELEKKNLPPILEYLPLVESDYNPNAKSRSGATGLWQFMENSVEGLLTYNEYIDERLDPWKSTEAALRKLQDNYKMFGDWQLAIAAYNCGAGALKKAIKKAGKKDFWYLCENGFISQQTSDYVPKLMAIADVAENALWYGVKMPTARAWNGTTLETRAGMFDYVWVKQSINLKLIAAELRLDQQTFMDLNSALIKGITPPGKEYCLRFPEGMKESASYALQELGFYTINK